MTHVLVRVSVLWRLLLDEFLLNLTLFVDKLVLDQE